MSWSSWLIVGGGFAQVIGAALVLFPIVLTRREVEDWLRKIDARATAIASSAMVGFPTAIVEDQPKASLVNRVDLLERRAESIAKIAANIPDEMRKQWEQDIGAAVTASEGWLMGQLNDLKARLGRLALGGFGWQLGGVALLVIGIVLATFGSVAAST